MATAKKLPSGNWRILAFSGYKIIDGKKRRTYESFTGKTKKDVNLQFALWQNSKHRDANMSVGEAIDGYISLKENVLSPSTVRGYKSMRTNYYSEIEDINLREADSGKIQQWISSLTATHSPKSVHHAYSLLLSSLNLYAPDKSIHVTLPKLKQKEYHLPSDEDLKILIDYCEDKKMFELEVAIMLSMYCSLRRGEICALEKTDLRGSTISISKCIVRDTNGGYVIKQPKTAKSFRKVSAPDFLVKKMMAIEGDKFVNCFPDALYDRFDRAVRASGIRPFNFHLLRHVFASKALMIMPEKYVQEMGGWKSNYVMRTIYENTFDSERKKNEKKLNEFWEMQHEMQHEI